MTRYLRIYPDYGNVVYGDEDKMLISKTNVDDDLIASQALSSVTAISSLSFSVLLSKLDESRKVANSSQVLSVKLDDLDKKIRLSNYWVNVIVICVTYLPIFIADVVVACDIVNRVIM